MEKRELWKERIEEQRSSGLTQKQWCDEKGVSVSGLRYWIQRLKKEIQKPQQTVLENRENPVNFTGIIIGPDVSDESSGLNQSSMRGAIEIKIGDLSCSVFPEFSEHHLLRVIRVLRKG